MAGGWTYDAYGAVINESVFVSGSLVNTCGHKGLFVERLDVGVIHAGVEAKRLAVGARLYGHVRNRGYGFDTGRWFQADPNATGMVVAESAHHGATPLPVVDQFDVAARYGDGANLYEYLGSSPWGRRDPMGLFIFDAVGAYMDIGFAAGRIAFGLATVYSENLSWDVEWATDWSQGDDWHSRLDASWIAEVYRDADINGAVNGYLDPTGGLLLGSGGRQAVEMLSLLQHGRRLSGKVMDLHHILPHYFRYIIDKSSDVGALIRHDLHRSYHEHVSKGMQRTLQCPLMRGGERKWRKWIDNRAAQYGGDKQMVKEEVKRELQRLTDEWGGLNGIPGLGEVLQRLLQ